MPSSPKLPIPNPDVLHREMAAILAGEGDNYARLNRLRDWFNANIGEQYGFELYLEDVWNDHKQGETWFEYILRSLHTKDETAPIGYDVYKNHQDAGGVWHLDEYVESVILMPDPTPLVAFVRENSSI